MTELESELLEELAGMVANTCTIEDGGRMCLSARGSVTDFFALELLERMGRVKRVRDGDDVTALFEWVQLKEEP